MFDNLTGKLQDALKKLRGQAVLTEANIADAMSEIRDALIDADVNLEIADEFIAEVRQTCLGADVLRSVTPGQHAVKAVYDKSSGTAPFKAGLALGDTYLYRDPSFNDDEQTVRENGHRFFVNWTTG